MASTMLSMELDDSVWDDEEEEAEDAEEPIDKEFNTDSEGEDDE